MKTIFSIILATFLLFGCGHIKTVNEPVVELIKTMQFNKEVLELCPKLDEKVFEPTFENIQSAYADIASKYVVCANKQYNSVKIIKEFGNIK